MRQIIKKFHRALYYVQRRYGDAKTQTFSPPSPSDNQTEKRNRSQAISLSERHAAADGRRAAESAERHNYFGRIREGGSGLMPIFHCKTIGKDGRINEFIREAVSEDSLVRQLTREDVSPISVREARQGAERSEMKKKFKQSKSVTYFGGLRAVVRLLLGTFCHKPS